ncbi:MAG: calcium-binding protein, partial [Candidatus Sedimenticola sp. 6PFRAG1]
MLQDYNEGWVTYEEYTAFQDYVLDYSVGEPYYGSIWTPIPDDFGFSPIGAFYDSQSTDYDNAPSIAHHTGVLLNAQNISITDQQLQVLDTDGDGQLSTTESAGLSYWQDINEDGHLDEGELVEVSQSVPQRDYGFYTQGNGQVGPEFQNEPVSTSITVSPHIHAPMTSRPGKVNLIQSVPGSNYRSLRDSDHLYILPNGFLEWMPDQIKINYNNKGYLIGTDGDDTFDGSYYANYPQYFNNNLLVNYLAGNGNDLMGGSSRSDRLWGGIGNDDLRGYAGDDKVYGEQGADQLQGQAGNDYLDGGSENDTLFGQVGNDTLHGGAGNDILMGFTATNEAKQTLGPGERDDDHLYGGDGDDQLHGGLGTDYLDGGLGNDELDGGAGNDLLHGGTGNDQLQGQSGNDRLLGESGDDKLFGQVGDDTLWGGEGNDILNGFTATNETKQTLSAGESDNDVLYGEGGNDKLWGGLGNDKLVGGTGNDLVDGSAGDDHLWGGDGQDQLQGGDGADMLDGGTDDDILIAGSGNDTLFGGGGVDELQGNEGDDRLHGENDNDKLFGQVGNDTLLGG